MEWIAEPDAAGGWLRELLDDDLGVVPRGFPAYGRVFHPATVRSPSGIDEPASWAEAASAFGTVMHPLAQWHRLVRMPPRGVGHEHGRIAPDGRAFSEPFEGAMPPALLAAIARHLVAHTATPDAGCAAVWEGWGGLVGGEGGSGRVFLEFDADPHHREMLERSIGDPFNRPFGARRWHPGILSDEISRGDRLRLPAREHVLFSAPPSAFADPAWVLDAPWRDRVAEERGFEPSAQHPSILWPHDRAWVLVSEIDFDSTIVCGPPELIAVICADPAIEALPIPAGADLSWDGDEVNP